MDNQPMTDLPEFTDKAEDAGKTRKKDKKKKEAVPDERTFLAHTRTLLAWIRTSTSLMTFGFASYKLLQQQAEAPGDHPLLQVIDPRTIGVVMIFSGFLGLLIADVGYIQFCRQHGRKPRQIYLNPAMLQSYVILALSLMILVGAFIGGHH
jgi:putative membrane protein